jgi:hypothetical protein
MRIEGEARRVSVYIGEADRHDGRPLHEAIVELLRREGCAGATVLRGIEGFGRASRIHSASILRLSQDLPVIIEWIDMPERVDRVLPLLEAAVQGGLVVVEDVRVVKYAGPDAATLEPS